MSTNVGAIDLDLVLNSQSFKDQLDTAVNGALKGVSKTASGTLMSSFGKLGKIVGGVFAVKKVIQFGSECLKLGSDLSEVQNVVDVTFGSMSGKVNEFAKEAIGTVGLSETVAKKYMGTFGAMGKAFGYSTKEAYDMSETLTKLSGDVASFYNLSTDEAYTKLKSVFTGETESLKELGVVMTQTALDAFAMEKGFGKTTKAMTEQEKVALRLAFVQDKLSDASGDFQRTAGSWANQVRVLTLQFDAFKASIGQGLINMLTPVIRMLNVLMSYLNRAADAFANFTAIVFGKQEAAATSAAAVTSELAGSVEGVGDAATGTAKAAKKALGGLAGFDRLNVISKGSSASSDSGASGAGNSTDSEELAEEVKEATPLVDQLRAKLQALKEDFRAGFEIGLGGASFKGIKANLESLKQSVIGIFADDAVAASANGFFSNLATSAGKVAGSISSWAITIGELFTGSISKYFEQNGGSLKEHIIGMFNISGEVATIVGDFYVAIADLFSVFKSPEAQQIGADIINIFVEPFLTATETLFKFGRDLTNAVLSPFIENIDGFKAILQNLLKNVKKITGSISKVVKKVCQTVGKVYDKYVKPMFENFGDGLSKIVSAITDAYNRYISPVLDRMGDKFSKVFEKHIGPAVEKIITVIGKACDLIGVLWKNFLAPLIAWVSEKILPVVGPVFEMLGTWIAGLVTAVADMAGGIADLLGGVIDFLIGVFTYDWKQAWEDLKKFTSDVWNAIWGSIKSVINFIIDGLNALWRGVYKVFKGIVDGIGGAVGWVGELFGKDWGFSMPADPPLIPKLAQGGYVEANTPQLAMIGDNRHQGEIIAPEGKITEAVLEALGPIVETLKQLGATIKAMGTGNGQNIIIKCILDGKVVYETVVKQNNAARRMRGGLGPLD